MSAVGERLREALKQVERLRRGAQGVRVQLESGVEAQVHRANATRTRLQEAEAALGVTKEALAEKAARRAKLAAALKAAERGLFRLDDTRNGSEGRIAAVEEAHAAELEALRGELGELQTELGAVNRTLLDERERAATDLGRVAAERSALTARVETLEQQLAAREGECARLVNEVERLTLGIGGLETQTRELTLSKAQALEAAAELQARLIDEESALEKIREQEAVRLAGLEQSVAAGRAREAALQRTLDQLRQSLEKEKAAAESAKTDLQGQLRMRQALEAELVKTRVRAMDLQTRLQNEEQHYGAQLARSAERCGAAERERDQLRADVDRLNAENERLDREGRMVRRLLESEQQKNELSRLHAKLEEVSWAHPDARRAAESGDRGEADASSPETTGMPSPTALPKANVETLPIVAIGASTGGPAALGEILPALPADFAACVLIVQHMPPGYTAELASHLDQRCAIAVAEARHGDPIRPGAAFIAPGGHHMELKGGTIRLSAGPPVNKQRPSADVLFDSLVSLAKRVQVVLLTGMGHDGVAGMSRLRAAGAETVVQDQASSVVWGMPGSAVKAGAASLQLPPADIGRYLLRKVAASRPPDGDEQAASVVVEAHVAG